MSEDLAVIDNFKSAMLALGEKEDALPVPTAASETTFFPYVRLFNAKSKQVEIESRIGANHYGLVVGGGEIEVDLGKEFETVFFWARDKAQIFEDGRYTSVQFDPASDEFKKIVALQAEQSTLGWQQQTAKVGKEVLLWIGHEEAACFATWFLGWNKSHSYLVSARLRKWFDDAVKAGHFEPKPLTVFGGFETMRKGKEEITYWAPKLRPSKAEMPGCSELEAIAACTKFRMEKPYVAWATEDDDNR